MKRKGNRVVVITGASSGFGRGAALRFAKAGDNVVIAARRGSLLEDVAKQCRKAGVEALVVEADVSKAADVEKLAEKALNKFGHHVWVNNAAWELSSLWTLRWRSMTVITPTVGHHLRIAWR